ncbi:MAG: hypothetical protein B7Z66_11615 [Chromatiales bacterium 21-64-14]|nr:MAG: hypothetical protein B7Z66_11615 [Chromatiales bacterium 21-64-14]
MSVPEQGPAARERLLDVNDLEPPEPMERALDALEQLPPGHYLRMLLHREPYLLYPLLDEDGFRFETRPGRRALFEILIWRVGDEDAERAVLASP